MKKQRIHEVVVKARFDAPMTAKQARYAVWNHVHGLKMYGDGKPRKNDPDSLIYHQEPYDLGQISVSRSAAPARR